MGNTSLIITNIPTQRAFQCLSDTKDRIAGANEMELVLLTFLGNLGIVEGLSIRMPEACVYVFHKTSHKGISRRSFAGMAKRNVPKSLLHVQCSAGFCLTF